jgi:hypothetical protein
MEFVIGVVVSVFIFLYFRQTKEQQAVAVGNTTADTPISGPTENASQVLLRQAVAIEPSTSEGVSAAVAPLTAAAESPQALPQEATLRRHYVTHVRYMIESVTFPRPTENDLRRHYDHLISSELENCLSDSTYLQQVIGKFEAQKKAA